MPCDANTRSGESGGAWRLINPLCVRFSQPRIAPHYRDGHLLDEALHKIYESNLESGPPDERTPLDAAAGVPPYDTLLVPPFPTIRVISWRPKIRNKDGEAEKDAHGDQILGNRAWFALDNRRLHTLQRAAASRWPKRCCIAVRCVEEVPGGAACREIRKFRTTTEGKCVDIGVRQGQTSQWCWKDTAPAGVNLDALGEEGLFVEDLYDANVWAPQAVSAAGDGPNGSEEDEADAPTPAVPSVAAAPPRASMAGSIPGAGLGAGLGGMGLGMGLGAGLMAAHRDYMGPQLAPCPAGGWEYIDPMGKIQGPFLLDKMRQWHSHGFFYPDLPMRCDPLDRFVKFAELFPAGMLPFHGAVVRYK